MRDVREVRGSVTLRDAWVIEDKFRDLAGALGIDGNFPDPAQVVAEANKLVDRFHDVAMLVQMELRRFYYV